MTGQEHAAEAERLVSTIAAHKLGTNETFAAIEMAHVHATLALAAEQRTANLIAWYGFADAAGDLPDLAAELAGEIQTRLGLSDGAA